jgi:hypothetical protein
MVKKLLACAMAATVFAGAVPTAFAQAASNPDAALQVAQNGTSGGATGSGMSETRNPAFDASAPPLSAGGAAGLETATVFSTPVLLGLAGAAVLAGVLVAAGGGGSHTSTTTTTAH